MGERLNLEFIQDGKVIGNAYYHWSAYTQSSIELTKMALNRLEEIKEQKYSARLMVSHALHATGAKMTPEEFEWLKRDSDTTKGDRLSYITQYALYPSPANRNNGLIGFSPESIKETSYWANKTVQVNLDTNFVNFGAMYVYDSAEKLRQDYDLTEEEMEKVFRINRNLDMEALTLEDLDYLSIVCKDAYDSNLYTLISPDGKYYSMIE